MKRFGIAIAIGLGTILPAAAQIGQNTAPDQGAAYTISVRSQLVVEAVTVKDKSGRVVRGLQAKDFVLTEDGVPQKISFCDFQQLPVAAEAIPLPPQQENLKLYNRLLLSRIAPEPPGNANYRDKRLIVLYFDMTALPSTDQQRALLSAMDFVRKKMTSADLVALMRYSGGSVDVLQDFTADRNRLLSILSTLSVGEGQGDEEMAGDASTSDTGAAFGQDSSEFNIFNTDRQLSALQTAVQMLGQLKEKKALIYFASGLRLNSIDNQAQLNATEQAAIKAGVSLWPVDARGLVATAPLGDATQGSQGSSAVYTGASALAVTNNFQKTQDTLYALGADTGGKALLDNNDLSLGITQAQESMTSYYILAYYPTNRNQDGRFRRIRISLATPAPANLDYRQGYYSEKVFSQFTKADKERQLEEALLLGDPITELAVAMEINYFQINSAEYFVPIVVNIPGRELALAKQHGAEHTLIDFIGEIKDDLSGMTITNLRDHVDVKLSDATAQDLTSHPIEYDTGFTLLPGKYRIKFLARDDETGRIGTYETAFVIPNLSKEDVRVPISSVVLSRQKADSRDVLYNAANSKTEAKDKAANPLVQNGQKLIPSVTRVFNKTRSLYVYLQGYESAVIPAQPLIGYVSLYRDGARAYQSQSIEVTGAASGQLRILPLSFSLDLRSLQPGQYDCQVTVVNLESGKAAFWQAPILIVP